MSEEEFITGKPLIKLLNLDRLNKQMDVQSDGVFDFIEGITVKSSNGRIIFPVREPFGNHLASKFVIQLLQINTPIRFCMTLP